MSEIYLAKKKQKNKKIKIKETQTRTHQQFSCVPLIREYRAEEVRMNGQVRSRSKSSHMQVDTA